MIDEPDPNDVKHEIEMGAEELLGHALPGNIDERRSVLRERVAYLTEQRAKALDNVNYLSKQDGIVVNPQRLDDAIAESKRLGVELRRAEQLLSDFEAQHKSGRN